MAESRSRLISELLEREMERARAEEILQENVKKTDAICRQVAATVDEFYRACLQEQEKVAEELRDRVLILQGEMMDSLATNIKLMRQMGLALPKP